jgi:hypothetical protein
VYLLFCIFFIKLVGKHKHVVLTIEYKLEIIQKLEERTSTNYIAVYRV